MSSVVIGGESFRGFGEEIARIRNSMLAEARFAAEQQQVAQANAEREYARQQTYGGFRPSYAPGSRVGGGGGLPGSALHAQIRNSLLAQDRADQQAALSRYDRLNAQRWQQEEAARDNEFRTSQAAQVRNDLLAREAANEAFRRDEMNQRGAQFAVTAGQNLQRLTQDELQSARNAELENKKYQAQIESRESIAEKNNQTRATNAALGGMYKQYQQELRAAANGDPQAAGRAALLKAQMDGAATVQSRYAALASPDGEVQDVEPEAIQPDEPTGPAPTRQGWTEMREAAIDRGDHAGAALIDRKLKAWEQARSRERLLANDEEQVRAEDPVARAAYAKYQQGRADKAAVAARQERTDALEQQKYEDGLARQEDAAETRRTRQVEDLKKKPWSSLSQQQQSMVKDEHPFNEHMTEFVGEFDDLPETLAEAEAAATKSGGERSMTRMEFLQDRINKVSLGNPDPEAKAYRDELRKSGIKSADMITMKTMLKQMKARMERRR